MSSSSMSTQWIFYAITSGACAALNGVFAKLTTTQLTSSWAHGVSQLFGFSDGSVIVEGVIRGFFFTMNLAFNAVMWGLFTRALTLASSTVRVSVINTSANFFITAILGAIIFTESLPPLWFLGAALLVTGSVIIGRREEGKVVGAAGTAGGEPPVGLPLDYSDEPDEPLASLTSVSVERTDSVELGGTDADQGRDESRGAELQAESRDLWLDR